MTPDATNDLPQGGIDSAQPSTDLNDPSNLDFEDDSETPNDVQGTKAGTDPDRETDEASAESDSQEADESEQDATTEDTESEAKAPAEVNLPDDALVTLPNGEKVKFKDLRESPMLKADHTRKTQALQQERSALGEQATRLQNVTESFVNYLASQLPPMPDASLAYTDPTAYNQQRAWHEAKMAEIQSVIQTSEGAKAEAKQLSETEFMHRRMAAQDAVKDRLPFLGDPIKAREFDRSVAEAAAFIGYSERDVAGMTDPRQFLLAHYAAKGIKAEQAEKKVTAKVQAAPAATPAKTAATKGNPQFLRNKEAMRRLEKSGSINDAMAIDFD